MLPQQQDNKLLHEMDLVLQVIPQAAITALLLTLIFMLLNAMDRAHLATVQVGTIASEVAATISQFIATALARAAIALAATIASNNEKFRTKLGHITE